MSGLLAVTVHTGWAHLRIQRADKRNALNQAARQALREALQTLAGQAQAVVLTGSERWFCCGADLKERAQHVADGQPDTAGEEGIALAGALREYPGVVIAAVNGLALGYGVNLVNCADLALAADTAQLGLPELRAGGYASMSAATSQLAGLGRKRLAWMVYGAEPIDAQTALAWGLVNQVVPAHELDAHAEALARRIAGFDAAALAETKAALQQIPEATDWRLAMQAGQGVAARIRQRRAGA
ncbi:enoyl-CoA hydratase/isomerase family protein [Pseudorhodoferax sp.]|uniref:enoyl-CoA hydratase/isomerase family protein n=1 Tax=Pseudorhodoferax sp. TaxID=1993553 RepID=UPI002DD6442F|nr:enoyl-CoA hydratase/isomerase family protein [Pseudorhodoferax sp.]